MPQLCSAKLHNSTFLSRHQQNILYIFLKYSKFKIKKWRKEDNSPFFIWRFLRKIRQIFINICKISLKPKLNQDHFRHLFAIPNQGEIKQKFSLFLRRHIAHGGARHDPSGPKPTLLQRLGLHGYQHRDHGDQRFRPSLDFPIYQ